MAAPLSIKRLLIEKSNSMILTTIAAACFLVVFCIVASIALFSQFTYQGRVISASQAVRDRLNYDIQSTQQLVSAYSAFTDTPTNIIGGTSGGSGPQDGNNAKIILDALPSAYDYPALASSLEAILANQSVKITSITGTDNSGTQSTLQTSSTPVPQPMPFQVTVTGNYTSMQSVISAFEHSIRPFQIETFELSGNQNQLQLTLTAQTYWQPAKNLNIRTEIVQ